MLSDSVRDFMTENHKAVLSTFRRNGAAQLSIISRALSRRPIEHRDRRFRAHNGLLAIANIRKRLRLNSASTPSSSTSFYGTSACACF